MAGLPVNTSTTIYGDRLMLYYGGKPIALGQSCSIDISADTLDTSNKMSGNWKEYLTGQLSFSISSESLLTYSETSAEGVDLSKYSTFKDIIAAMVERTPVEFEIATAKDADNDFALKSKFISGTAIITQASVNAQAGQLTTCSIQLQGSGALTVADKFDDTEETA